ncbi:hypothetical protein D3C87_1147560 [compost metagenome]
MELALCRGEVFQQHQALSRVQQASVQFLFCTVNVIENLQPRRRRPEQGSPRVLNVESAALGQQKAIGQRQDISLTGTLKDQ